MSSKALPKKAILIVNAKSRQGAESFEEARKLLHGAGIELIDAHAVKSPEDIDKTVKASIAKAPMVILGGGDGTISSNVDHFIGSDTLLAMLPLGTANSFARTLGIPLDLADAVGVIAKGQRKPIDLGCIDGDHFANTAVVGLSPIIADTIPAGLKQKFGRFGYLLWAARCAMRFSPFRLTITADGEQSRFWATEVRIANGGHFGGIEVVESADVDSGTLVVQAVTGRSKGALARSWLAALARIGSRNVGEVVEMRGRNFKIETQPRMRVAIDGESEGKTPIDVSIALAAIEIVVPKASRQA